MGLNFIWDLGRFDSIRIIKKNWKKMMEINLIRKKIPQVELFTSEHCYFCEIMEEFLLDLQEFYDFDIKKVVVKKTPSKNISKLPMIRVIGGKEVVGFMPKEDLNNIIIRQLF